MAHVAKTLSGDTLRYSPHTYQKSRLYVKVKIVFEPHEDPTWNFFVILHIFCPITCKFDKSQNVVDITSICNLYNWKI